MEKIDLHLHTNLSDGEFSPDKLVKRCVNVGCKKIAITDHDRINDYSDLSIKYGIPIVSGIEFNTSYDGMHILGYGFDKIFEIQNKMYVLARENEEVCYKIIDHLYSDGFDISVEQVLECMKNMGISVCYLSKKHIVKYLIHKEYVKNVFSAYNELMGSEQKYYHPIKKLSKYEVLDLIKSMGGVAVLAHPSTLYLSDYDLEKEVRGLMAYGLDGIEVKNRCITSFQSISYQEIANKLGLISTMGSDFHSPHLDIIGVEASEEIYENLQKRIVLSKRK